MNAIKINEVSFKYNKQLILNSISAQIGQNDVYALLGPSGCGKTTLLRLIFGRIKPKSGSITVLGHEPGLANSFISYMPQECALCLQFTVNQTLDYFARIFRISKQDYIERKQKLDEVMSIPEGKRLISELSGGQQKVVSLAIALLNESKFIILDEPTVGIDLMTTSHIWKYLCNKCEQGLTILFVTQYVEEATHANKVAFMRNGKMLVEEKPSVLMQKYNEISLEKIFLKLCLIDDNTDKSCETDINQINNKLNSLTCDPNDDKKLENTSKDQNWGTIFWIILILIRRNFLKISQMGYPSMLLFLMPAIQALMSCLVFSKQIIYVETAIFNEDIDPYYSQKLLSSLISINQHMIKPVNYSTLDSALNSIHNNKAVAVIHFKQNYSQAINDRIEDPFNIDNKTMDESSLHLYLDNSMATYSSYFMASLQKSLENYLLMIYNEKSSASFEIPISVEKTTYSENLSTIDYYSPGFLLYMLYLSSMVTSSLALLLERKDGLYERSLISGVSYKLVIISHLITNIILVLIQTLLMFFIVFFIFNNRNEGSIVLLFFIFLSQAINSISTGFLISSIANDEYMTITLICLITLPQCFSSGVIWPIESLDRPLRDIFHFSPLILPINAMNDVMFKGYGLGKLSVLYGFAVSLFPGLIFIVLTIIIIKKK